MRLSFTDYNDWADKVQELYPNRPFIGQRMHSVFDSSRPAGQREVARWVNGEGWVEEKQNVPL